MTRSNRAVLLFPPNWSACVSGPHLALPLLAGAGRGLDWDIETWDLTQEFYRCYSGTPLPAKLVAAVENRDFQSLDEIYFAWEDRIRGLLLASEYSPFGLLSGFSIDGLTHLSLAEVAMAVRSGSAYTPFLMKHVLPRLVVDRPSLIGLTIASQEQVVPALELLQLIRTVLPNAFLLLGGNVVSRLRDTRAFDMLASLADQTVVFQGELAFTQILRTITEIGVAGARCKLPRVVSTESVPYSVWPVPSFHGISLDAYVGIPVLPYVSTRGCYWGKCHFCAIPAGWSSRGYGGSSPAAFVARQLVQMTSETGIARVKFVDEAIPPNKALALAEEMVISEARIEWEAYARLEPAWESVSFLERLRAGGLRKLYFGLEQAPATNRSILGKNDRGDPIRILHACKDAALKVHLFCMVGHPGSSKEDAFTTGRFLIENEEFVDTADMVGFRLDRGTVVPGVRPAVGKQSDWAMSIHFEPTEPGILHQEEIAELEVSCQEYLWETVPRLLHPLYRLVGPWDSTHALEKAAYASLGQR